MFNIKPVDSIFISELIQELYENKNTNKYWVKNYSNEKILVTFEKGSEWELSCDNNYFLPEEISGNFNFKLKQYDLLDENSLYDLLNHYENNIFISCVIYDNNFDIIRKYAPTSNLFNVSGVPVIAALDLLKKELNIFIDCRVIGDNIIIHQSRDIASDRYTVMIRHKNEAAFYNYFQNINKFYYADITESIKLELPLDVIDKTTYWTGSFIIPYSLILNSDVTFHKENEFTAMRFEYQGYILSRCLFTDIESTFDDKLQRFLDVECANLDFDVKVELALKINKAYNNYKNSNGYTL